MIKPNTDEREAREMALEAWVKDGMKRSLGSMNDCWKAGWAACIEWRAKENMEQSREIITIGEITISHRTNGGYWLSKPDGEGMEVHSALTILLEKFFKENM